MISIVTAKAESSPDIMQNTQQSYLQLLLQNTNHYNTKTQLDSKTPWYIHCPERDELEISADPLLYNQIPWTIIPVEPYELLETEIASKQHIGNRSVTDQ